MRDRTRSAAEVIGRCSICSTGIEARDLEREFPNTPARRTVVGFACGACIDANARAATIGSTALSDEEIDRVLFAVCNLHDGPELWKDTRRDPEAFRNAVRVALGKRQSQG